ncbi:MAG: ferredoxin [Desulfitibacter sp. BRH_c19]|nr:MAG: ferredoxin [Desulfitibacter sp. BRH_c19]
MMYLITIDQDKCDGCSECVDACPVSIIELVDGKAICEDASECMGCESCVSVCPNEAVKFQEL